MNAWQLMELGSRLEVWVAMILMYGIRPAVAFLVLPATTEPAMTPTIRHLLCAVFALHVAAGAAPGAFAAVATPAQLLVMGCREAVIGFVVGFAASQGFWIAQSVGALIDNLAGYNNVQLINPSSSEQNTPVSDLMLQLFVAVFWTSGGMLAMLGVLGQTYRWWPMLDPMPQWPVLPEEFAALQLTHLMRVVVSLSMPILFLLAFIDVGLGLVARAAKNVDTTPLGTPLKCATTLLALVLFSSVFLEDIKVHLALAGLPALLAKWHSLQ